MKTTDVMKRSIFVGLVKNPWICIKILLVPVLFIQLTGCISDDVDDLGSISRYQERIVAKSPQQRFNNKGLGALRPMPVPELPELEFSEPDTLKPELSANGITGKKTIVLTLEEAVKRVLISSPEINVLSYDPSIAKEELTKSVSEFDVTFFGRTSFENQDNPTDSIYQGGQVDTRLLETGIKQKVITGAEWSLAYALTRNRDDLITTTLPTRYEPALTFQIKQPLLRDAWQGVNLAGVNIAKLNYKITLAAFRQRTEDISAEVISLYWALQRAHRDQEIQQWLLDSANETFKDLEDRKDIDATDVQMKQAKAAVKSREAVLFQTKKQVFDVQDALVRFLSDSKLNLLNDFEIIPKTEPIVTEPEYGPESEVLELALANNPEIQQAMLSIEVAQINVDVAKRQKMPKLDLIASASTRALSDSSSNAHDRFYDADYVTYAIELTFEFPFGNREREAEYRKRKLEYRKSVSILQNTSDQLAAQVRERIRLAKTSYGEIQIQKEAVAAAERYLEALEETEKSRKLTPEYLLVKLQAQETLTDARRAEIKAITDYNTSLVRLAQSTGTVLDMRYVRKAWSEEGM